MRSWVVPRHLAAYVRWRFSTRKDWLTDLGRHIRGITLAGSDEPEIIDYLNRAAALGCEPGWIRYPTDGTRMQVFDPVRLRVCKLTKESRALLTRGLEARLEEANLPAPGLLSIEDDGAGLLEEYVESKPTDQSPGELLRDVLVRLDDHLYKPVSVEADCYRSLVRSQGDLDEELGKVLDVLLTRVGGKRLPVSLVHGDLTPSNLRVDGDGRPILVDWEFSRTCLLSYDCWLYLYCRQHQEYGFQRGDSDHYLSFINDFQDAINSHFPVLSELPVFLLHSLHLIERISFLRGLKLDSTRELRRSMRRNLRRASLSA